MSVSVNFVLGQFAEDFCIESPQQFADALVAILTGTIAGNFSGVIIAANPPQVTDQDKLWVKTDATGRPVGIYLYKGTWLWPNPRSASSNERMIWVGSEAALWAHDGGDGTDPSVNTPTATTGAMWQRDTNFDFRFPLGIGTNPTTYDGNPASSAAVGDTGGEERHVLAGDEALGDHAHPIGKLDNAGQIDFYAKLLTADPSLTGTGYRVKGNGSELTADFTTLNKQELGSFNVNAMPDIVSHQNMPPWRGVIFAKRTNRTYYTAN